MGQDVSGENGYRSGWGAERVVMVNSFEFVWTSQLRLGTPLVDAKLHDARFEIMFLCAVPSSTLHRTIGRRWSSWGDGRTTRRGWWSLAVSVGMNYCLVQTSLSPFM